MATIPYWGTQIPATTGGFEMLSSSIWTNIWITITEWVPQLNFHAWYFHFKPSCGQSGFFIEGCVNQSIQVNFSKAVFHKFCLAYSWILCPMSNPAKHFKLIFFRKHSTAFHPLTIFAKILLHRYLTVSYMSLLSVSPWNSIC